MTTWLYIPRIKFNLIKELSNNINVWKKLKLVLGNFIRIYIFHFLMLVCLKIVQQKRMSNTLLPIAEMYSYWILLNLNLPQTLFFYMETKIHIQNSYIIMEVFIMVLKNSYIMH